MTFNELDFVTHRAVLLSTRSCCTACPVRLIVCL